MARTPWWQRGIIYQIYPRSFVDSNGDGSAISRDIAGASTSVSELGVDAIWISPIFRSPMKDFGYDVSRYTGIDPVFGTLADFDELMTAAHARVTQGSARLRAEPHLGSASVVLESRSVPRQSEARLVHLARSGAGRGPPNNWLSSFGGSAWECDERPDSIIYHAFLRRAAGSQLAQSGGAGRRCTTCCGSGSSAVSTAFAST